MPDLPLITVPLPRGGVGSIEPGVARAKADEVFDDLVRFLSLSPAELERTRPSYLDRFPEARAARQASAARRLLPPIPETERIEDTLDAAARLSDDWAQRGWTDGHPVVVPTVARLQAMLEACGKQPGEVLGILPPKYGVGSAGVVAANAVMAGCEREYLPVVVAAVEAITDPIFKMNHLASTASPWPAFIVNGPIIKEIGLNSGASVMGPGCRPNITIGRAISLTMANCMDAKVGGVRQGIMGIPSRSAGQVIAEDETRHGSP